MNKTLYLLFILCLVGMKTYAQESNNSEDQPKIKSVYFVKSENNEGFYNDEIIIQLSNLNFKAALSANNSPILYLNSRPFKYLDGKVNPGNSTIYFNLGQGLRVSEETAGEITIWDYFNDSIEKQIQVSVGTEKGELTSNFQSITVQFYHYKKGSLSYLVALAVWIILIPLAFNKSNLFRNEKGIRVRSKDKDTPSFSYSKYQMYLWTGIIIISYAYISFQIGALIELDLSHIALFTIPATSFIAANFASKPEDDKIESANCFTDIIKDNSGYSLSRVQGLLFNFIYATIFVWTVCESMTMIVFSPEQLAVLGISVATYNTLKSNLPST